MGDLPSRRRTLLIAVAPQRLQRAYASILIALAPLGCVLLYARDPAHGHLYPPCPFHAMTGLDCPGCGTLRALHQLSHGHVGTAFGLNPLSVVALPFLGYAFASSVISLARGRGLPELRLRGRLAWVVPIVVGAFWIARNIPWPPLHWMSAFH
jgi:hypothetical protein